MLPSPKSRKTFKRSAHTATKLHKKETTQVQATVSRRPVPHRSQLSLCYAARMAQSSEPILFPKLRIYFADFPYLRYSIGQRLFTLETCCGYGYDFARNLHTSPPDFQGPTQALRMAQDLCHFWWSLTLSPGKPIPGFTLCVENHLIRKDNSLRNLRQRLWIQLCHHTSSAP